jgi:hypothetical protein
MQDGDNNDPAGAGRLTLVAEAPLSAASGPLPQLPPSLRRPEILGMLASSEAKQAWAAGDDAWTTFVAKSQAEAAARMAAKTADAVGFNERLERLVEKARLYEKLPLSERLDKLISAADEALEPASGAVGASIHSRPDRDFIRRADGFVEAVGLVGLKTAHRAVTRKSPGRPTGCTTPQAQRYDALYDEVMLGTGGQIDKARNLFIKKSGLSRGAGRKQFAARRSRSQPRK